eukprot:2374591-Lingulodinium_polyedra.AAC.1
MAVAVVTTPARPSAVSARNGKAASSTKVMSDTATVSGLSGSHGAAGSSFKMWASRNCCSMPSRISTASALKSASPQGSPGREPRGVSAICSVPAQRNHV